MGTSRPTRQIMPSESYPGEAYPGFGIVTDEHADWKVLFNTLRMVWLVRKAGSREERLQILGEVKSPPGASEEHLSTLIADIWRGMRSHDDMATAEGCYHMAQELRPSFPESAFAFAREAILRGHQPSGLLAVECLKCFGGPAQEIELLLRSVLSIGPRDVEALAKARLHMGQLLQQQRKPDEARRHFTKALKYARRYGFAEVRAKSHLLLADLALTRRSKEEATKHLRIARKTWKRHDLKDFSCEIARLRYLLRLE